MYTTKNTTVSNTTRISESLGYKYNYDSNKKLKKKIITYIQYKHQKGETVDEYYHPTLRMLTDGSLYAQITDNILFKTKANEGKEKHRKNLFDIILIDESHEQESIKNTLSDVNSPAQPLVENLINTQVGKVMPDAESDGQQINSNATAPTIINQPKDVLEVGANLDVDKEPLISSVAIGDEMPSLDAVSDTLFSDTAAHEGQSKTQRSSKTSGNKKKKDNL